MNKLREIRLKKKLTIKDASKMLGVSACYLSQIENGNRELSRNMLKRFCDVYNVNPNDILEYENFVLLDDLSTEFNEQDIAILRLIKQMSDSDKDEIYNFLSYLIWKHNQRIEAMKNDKKTN